MSPRSASSLKVDARRALALVQELMAIPGRSGEERQVAQFIESRLRAAGAPSRAVFTDTAHQRTPLAGQVGNLILKLPGTRRAPRRLLTAHLDTVPICVGCRPVRRGPYIKSADPQTGLGADNRAGCAVLLTAAEAILRDKLPHPPLTFCWFVQEEIGLYGARMVTRSALGNPRLAFNWDGGPAPKLTVGATGGYRMTITVRGRASHAGGAPERGVSAIAIAARAIAELDRQGWHGKIEKKEGQGTSNVGVIQGGAATNVVTELVTLRAEARSHQPDFRRRIVDTIEQAFTRAAQEVRSSEGITGRVEFDGHLDYEAFRLRDDEPCVLAAEAAIRQLGEQPLRALTNGGLDANWLTQHGIPSVTLGCGQQEVHTVDEALDIEQFQLACRIGLLLATATEEPDPGT